MYVKTNVAKFFEMSEKYFPKGNPLRKVFNKDMLKLNCSCMSNKTSIISSYNRKHFKSRGSTRIWLQLQVKK